MSFLPTYATIEMETQMSPKGQPANWATFAKGLEPTSNIIQFSAFASCGRGLACASLALVRANLETLSMPLIRRAAEEKHLLIGCRSSKEEG